MNHYLFHYLSIPEILFDSIPISIAYLDRKLTLQRFNAAWADFMSRYTNSDPAFIKPGIYYFDLDPDTRSNLSPLLKQVWDGEIARKDALPLVTKHSTTYWDMVFIPLMADGQVNGLLNIIINATERVQTRLQLERTLTVLSEHQQDLTSLLENAKDFVVFRIAVDPDAAYSGRVILVSPSIMDVMGIPNPYQYETWFENMHPEDASYVISVYQKAIEKGEPYNLVTRIYQPVKKEWIWIHIMSNPVFDEDGRLSHFNGLILDISQQKRTEAALQDSYQTLEQKVLERTYEIEQRRKAADSLHDILMLLNSARPLDEILQVIISQACELTEADAGAVYHYAGNDFTVEAIVGMPSDFNAIEPLPVVYLKTQPPYAQQELPYGTNLEIAIGDGATPDESMLNSWYEVIRKHFKAKISVPITILEQPYGMLELYYRAHRPYSEDIIDLARMTGNQTALAIENARLRIQAEKAAVANERNRIARELHDSVSQALYGIALGTRTARTLLERHPGDASLKSDLADPLDYILSLADAGLAEMRALIFELRPEALEREGLNAALSKLADAVRSRHQLDVQIELCDEIHDLPLILKETLFRVAQEAVNNLIKHAQATHVIIKLTCEQNWLILEIQDDGVGFNPKEEYHGHIGLQLMHERMTRLGGKLDIQSTLEQGTIVKACLPI